MQRREFLAQASTWIGSTSVAAAGQVEKPAAELARQVPTTPPRIVIAGAHLSGWLAEAGRQLEDRFPVKMITWTAFGAPLPAEKPDPRCQLVEGDNVEALQKTFAGADVLVLALPELQEQTPQERVEEATRRVYLVLQAAQAAAVKACLLVSSLTMFELYDEDFLVDEDWQPRPLDYAHGLGEYLAELVCREFAREKLLRVLGLRFGRIVDRPPPLPEARRLGWVLRGDAIRALCATTELLAHPKREALPWWACVHIGGKCPPSRFPTVRAERLLGYRPQDI